MFARAMIRSAFRSSAAPKTAPVYRSSQLWFSSELEQKTYRNRETTYESNNIASSEYVLKLKGQDKTKLVGVPTTESIPKCSKLMFSKKIGSVLVEENGKRVGLITERDIVKAFTKDNPEKLTVADCMTPMNKLISVTRSDGIDDCVNTMNRNRIRHLLVMESGSAHSDIYGIMSMKDVMLAIAQGYVCPRCWEMEAH